MGNYIKECAIIGIVVIEAVALSQGINGLGMATAIGALAGIAGWSIHGAVQNITAKKK